MLDNSRLLVDGKKLRIVREGEDYIIVTLEANNHLPPSHLLPPPQPTHSNRHPHALPPPSSSQVWTLLEGLYGSPAAPCGPLIKRRAFYDWDRKTKLELHGVNVKVMRGRGGRWWWWWWWWW